MVLKDYFTEHQIWDTLVALGSGASFVYSTFALFAMTNAQMTGNGKQVMAYMHEFYFESAAMIFNIDYCRKNA